MYTQNDIREIRELFKIFPHFKIIYQGVLKHKEKKGTELEINQLKDILR